MDVLISYEQLRVDTVSVGEGDMFYISHLHTLHIQLYCVAGAFGVVYRATLKLDKTEELVAVKTIKRKAFKNMS